MCDTTRPVLQVIGDQLSPSSWEELPDVMSGNSRQVDEGFKLMPQAGLAVHEFVFYIYRYFEQCLLYTESDYKVVFPKLQKKTT